ncbi:hypothetical protein [Ruegeria sp. SCP11]|uniref:hypothetical protein n=1 Tax=Ruegeria sp. SCP11 TaxID=3141378 RepID=UPI00333B5249
MVGFFDEPVSVVTEGMRLEHLQHFWTGALHNGDACQKGWTDVERQVWMLGRGRERSLPGDDVIEVWGNSAENPVAPPFCVAREWPGHPAHQKKAGKFQR